MINHRLVGAILAIGVIATAVVGITMEALKSDNGAVAIYFGAGIAAVLFAHMWPRVLDKFLEMHAAEKDERHCKECNEMRVYLGAKYRVFRKGECIYSETKLFEQPLTHHKAEFEARQEGFRQIHSAGPFASCSWELLETPTSIRNAGKKV